ncbi:MAG: GGDEF domain-containing protein [Xanthomonadales bacterium]|nr:GGDEF domain-containing protein [Xanthomonadales bacterium]
MLRTASPLLLALALWLPPMVCAQDSSALPRHPLERQALLDPDGALQRIADELSHLPAEDDHERALLLLAQANACRVIADWQCQRDAGRAATQAAERAGVPHLAVRGLIAEARGAIAIQDYHHGEERLAAAELLLREHPNAELQADVALGYSSMSHALGKHAVAADYAQRGLDALSDPNQALPMRVRLLRNRGRALAQLGDRLQARALLRQATEISSRFDDPKLSAELYLEAARMARIDADHAAQREYGQAVLALGERLRNSQLQGLGLEVLGLAALDEQQPIEAIGTLDRAYAAFRDLALHRDQLRVGRELLRLLLDHGDDDARLHTLIRQTMALDEDIIQADRAQSAADFQARLERAEQQAELIRLEADTRLTQQRAERLAETERLTRWLALATLAGLLILAALFGLQRRSHRRLARTLADLQESRTRAREYLGLSSGMVCLHNLRGQVVDLNPGAAEALGIAAGAAETHHLDEVVVDTAQQGLQDYLTQLRQQGHAEMTLRFRRSDGSHAHWRVSARAFGEDSERRLVLMQALDVTDQVEQAEELRSMALRDPLTGCFNRRYLTLFELQQSDPGWATLVIDLDQFKRINDAHGHEHGDQVLRDFASFLRQHLPADGALVRSGGDEFILLLSAPEALPAKQLMQQLERHRDDASCAFSVGLALRQGRESLISTIARADRSMYGSKDQRRQG